MRKIVNGIKDSNGAYLPQEPASKPAPEKPVDTNLDNMLYLQLETLARATGALHGASYRGLTKDEIQSLNTCIKLTMELKAKEKELLDNLTDEELEKLAK
jgi:hypothetical protein